MIIDGELRKLDDTHADHDNLIDRWQFWGSAYEGGEDFVKKVLLRNSRETQENFESRLDEGEVFNYCETIVDLFCNFLSQQQVHRNLDRLANDEQWDAFVKDVDLFGTNYSIFLNSTEKLASVYGMVGILLDKPKGKIEETGIRTRADELKQIIYPYCSIFIPENILDWEFTRNPLTARPELTYLKLKEENGYLAWTTEEWERWTLKPGYQSEYELSGAGANPLKEIPFIWHTNSTNFSKPVLGVSDIKGISKIQAAITRDLSNGSEIIKYAAFPMMRKPMVSNNTEEEDLTGVTAILQFDPEYPNSKPDWLEAKVSEPVDAILKWVERKVLEIYRTSHLSNVHGQASSASARSGVALKYEYQQLSSVLTAKGNDQNETELKIVYFWCKWQGQVDIPKKVTVTRPAGFNIDDLSSQLDNCLVSTTIVQAETFKKALQKKIARMVLSEEPEEVIKTIDDEIDEMDLSEKLEKEASSVKPEEEE